MVLILDWFYDCGDAGTAEVTWNPVLSPSKVVDNLDWTLLLILAANNSLDLKLAASN